MEILKGGRDWLENELADEVFKPGDNRERIAGLIRQLMPAGRLRLLELARHSISGEQGES